MLCAKYSPKLHAVETDEVGAFHCLFWRTKWMRGKRKLRAETPKTQKCTWDAQETQWSLWWTQHQLPFSGSDTASVLMCCNRCKTSLMLLQPSKHMDASKLLRIQRVATLWLEVSPNVPSAAAWSAHSLPRFPSWPYTCCMVSRSLCWRRS